LRADSWGITGTVQASYSASFEREMGCTVAELLRWLPGASGAAAVALDGDSARIGPIGDGALQLAWQVLPPRRIALIAMPRIHIRFSFEGVDEAARHVFMRHFDLYTQRGGG
jgi:hypothetical protein